MLRFRPWAFGLAAAAMLAIAPWAAAQDELEQDVQQLRAIIQALQDRVAGLEAELEASKEAPSEDLVQRVDALEQAAGQTPGLDPNDFRVYWKDSLRFETANGRHKLRIGGRIMTDFAWFSQDEDDTWLRYDLQDGAEFRRARIYLSGTVYDNIDFKAQYDFAGGDADFKDVYIAMDDLPGVGQIKVGHFKEPFSLEELTSSKYITFMERALPNVFSPSRNTGVQVSNSFLDDRMTVAAGLFRYDTDGYGDQMDEDSGWNATARVTGLPWYANDGAQLLHLGLSYSHQNPDEGTFRYRQRPEAHMTPVRFVDTSWRAPNRIRADAVNLYDLEAALVYGPFSVQGEYMLSDVDADWAYDDLDFDGWYAEASYFLTGEHRNYKASGGKFDSISPKNPFSLDGSGWGAWQVAARYSTLDLNSGWAIRGGQEDNYTLGLNWYLNKTTRIMLNYVNADIDHDLFEGDIDIFQTRFQFAF